jgi:hypothetical protein
MSLTVRGCACLARFVAAVVHTARAMTITERIRELTVALKTDFGYPGAVGD